MSCQSSAHHPIYVASVPQLVLGLRTLQQMQVVKTIIGIESSAALTLSEEVKQISTLIVSKGVFQSVSLFIFFKGKKKLMGLLMHSE